MGIIMRRFKGSCKYKYKVMLPFLGGGGGLTNMLSFGWKRPSGAWGAAAAAASAAAAAGGGAARRGPWPLNAWLTPKIRPKLLIFHNLAPSK